MKALSINFIEVLVQETNEDQRRIVAEFKKCDKYQGLQGNPAKQLVLGSDLHSL